MSPFQTPRKKFKYTSGLDLSGLVHAHSPSKGSPLKQSVTPSKRREKREMVDISDSDGEADEVEATPTKRRGTEATPTKSAMKAKVAPGSPRSARQKQRDQIEKEGKAAFLALRPGAVPKIQVTAEEEEDEVTPRRRSPARRLVDEFRQRPTRQRQRRRMDWTFKEKVWAEFDPEGELAKERRRRLEEVLNQFEPVDEPMGTVDEIIMNAFKAKPEAETA